MEKTMTDTANTLLNKGKKSLATLLREKAYEEIVQKLEAEGININDVDDIDIEALVAARVQDMKNGIKNFAVGGATALLLSSILGF